MLRNPPGQAQVTRPKAKEQSWGLSSGHPHFIRCCAVQSRWPGSQRKEGAADPYDPEPEPNLGSRPERQERSLCRVHNCSQFHPRDQTPNSARGSVTNPVPGGEVSPRVPDPGVFPEGTDSPLEIPPLLSLLPKVPGHLPPPHGAAPGRKPDSARPHEENGRGGRVRGRSGNKPKVSVTWPRSRRRLPGFLPLSTTFCNTVCAPDAGYAPSIVREDFQQDPLPWHNSDSFLSSEP
ncbi:uncharacterized protein LOC132347355 [Balaenoptera ricei]|uniref:uncharacterized protein LOC132347355 n=1 Tax=Balaenoptera ricei TaxID=2746895 RepID=UPI0028BE4C5C|nr:uncharacterized protein LOC132347355 [Balaenoptera ricei]